MNPPTRLVLIRHTEPEESATGRCYGSSDIGLSARGHAHAEQIADALSGVGCVAVYTSPLTRARTCALRLAARTHCELHLDPAFKELDFGDFEGLTYREIEQRDPERFTRWMAAPTTVAFPHGESFHDLCQRVGGVIDNIVRQHAGEVVVLVTHAGVVRAILVEVLNMSPEAAFRLDQSYGAINLVDWIDHLPLLRVMNGAIDSVASRDGGFLAPYDRPARRKEPHVRSL